MWYNIDRESLTFKHKHKELEAVQLLAWLEAPNCACVITSFGSEGSLHDFTLMELHKLYSNTTGEKWKGFQEQKLRKDIAAVAYALDSTDCDLEELRKQISTIKKGDKQAYRYVRGASKPALADSGLYAIVINGLSSNSSVSDTFEYEGDPKIGASVDRRSESDLDTSVMRSQRTRSDATQRRATVLATITRPETGVGAEIWKLLDENESMRDGIAIQIAAKERGWQTLTAILQLSQWKKFNEK